MAEGQSSAGRQKNSVSFKPISTEILKEIFEIYIDTSIPSI